VQIAIGYSPKVMVTRADRHSGQRGISEPLGCFVLRVGGVNQDGRRALVGVRWWWTLSCLSLLAGTAGRGCLVLEAAHSGALIVAQARGSGNLSQVVSA
jgi:hypothetical protein